MTASTTSRSSKRSAARPSDCTSHVLLKNSNIPLLTYRLTVTVP